MVYIIICSCCKNAMSELTRTDYTFGFVLIYHFPDQLICSKLICHMILLIQGHIIYQPCNNSPIGRGGSLVVLWYVPVACLRWRKVLLLKIHWATLRAAWISNELFVCVWMFDPPSIIPTDDFTDCGVLSVDNYFQMTSEPSSPKSRSYACRKAAPTSLLNTRRTSTFSVSLKILLMC